MTVSFEKYYQIFFFQLISQSCKCEIFLYIKGLFKKKKFILPKKRNQVRTRTVFRQCIQRGPKASKAIYMQSYITSRVRRA